LYSPTQILDFRTTLKLFTHTTSSSIITTIIKEAVCPTSFKLSAHAEVLHFPSHSLKNSEHGAFLEDMFHIHAKVRMTSRRLSEK